MRPLERLGAGDLRVVVRTFRDVLERHRARLNRLNVYPVPDGDTGTNMALTVESVLAELEDAGDDLVAVCRAIAHGSLMGARGNSGVILSQILRGMTSAFVDQAAADRTGTGEGSGAGRAVDGAAFARGLVAAADGAYQAVGRPVEGTILTVARAAAEAGQAAAGRSPAASLAEVVDAALDGAQSALERTPELLDVLRRAGVVDAGGAGFVLLLHAAVSVVAGREVPGPGPEPVGEPQETDSPVAASPGSSGDGDGSLGDLRYEVMYLLEAPDEELPAFREAWAAIGDSIVVVGGEGTWNCHIHCDDVGAAIEAGIEAGRPRQIRVTDLTEQVQEERWVREAEGTTGVPTTGVPTTGVPTTGVVAVANGSGLRELFESLGAGSVVAGGQSMNPSTAQLLEAVEASPSEQIVILPNNANIVAVAEQVDRLSAKSVRVVATSGIAEGLAALLAYDPAADADHNAKAMGAAAADVVAGEVTRAVRSSVGETVPISEGDWLGIGPEGIQVVEDNAVDATVGLLDALAGPGHELAILIVGEDAVEAETAQITAWLSQHRPDMEVEVHHGGQPLYPYLLGVE